MHAMVLRSLRAPLEWSKLPDRAPTGEQIRVRVAARGVCRTDLHVVDGDLPKPVLPMVPGHEIVGRIDALRPDVEDLVIGQRVGIPWLGHTCGVCHTASATTKTGAITQSSPAIRAMAPPQASSAAERQTR